MDICQANLLLHHQNRRFCRLHARVIWPAATFRRDPHNVLRWVLDVAGFAMHTVLRVDLQAGSSVRVLDIFIHTCRAISGLWPGVRCKIDVDWNTGVFQCQMRRLVFFMIGVADENAGELVKRDLAVRPGVGDLWAIFGGL